MSKLTGSRRGEDSSNEEVVINLESDSEISSSDSEMEDTTKEPETLWADEPITELSSEDEHENSRTTNDFNRKIKMEQQSDSRWAHDKFDSADEKPKRPNPKRKVFIVDIDESLY